MRSGESFSLIDIDAGPPGGVPSATSKWHEMALVAPGSPLRSDHRPALMTHRGAACQSSSHMVHTELKSAGKRSTGGFTRHHVRIDGQKIMSKSRTRVECENDQGSDEVRIAGLETQIPSIMSKMGSIKRTDRIGSLGMATSLKI
jgi:hypothetical protein